MMSGTQQLELTACVRKSIQLLVEETPKAEVAESSGSGHNKHAQGKRQERRYFKVRRVAAPSRVLSDSGLMMIQPIASPFLRSVRDRCVDLRQLEQLREELRRDHDAHQHAYQRKRLTDRVPASAGVDLSESRQ